MPTFSVTTVNEDRGLLTEAELRSAVGVDLSDDQVADLGNRVAAAIVSACRVAAAGAVPPTLRLEAVCNSYRLKSAQDVLVLSRAPVTSIASIVENDVTLDADDYELDARSGILARLSDDAETTWPCGKIIVAYTAGWETVPHDLRAIAAELAQHYWSEGQQIDPNLRSLDIPGVISTQRWVESNTAPIPEHLMRALKMGGYVNQWFG